MKNRIKFLSVAALLAVLLCMTFSGCNRHPARKEHVIGSGQKTVLFLGDSIAEAMAGPSPLTERERYGYYGILGNINDYKFYNRAISGDQTSDLYDFIQREDDGINMVKSLITDSDIIHVSIGGNDLLGHSVDDMIINAGQGDYSDVDRYLENAYNNLDKIITKLREMNPDAIIILQTQYNPVGKDSPLIGNRARTRLNAMAYTPNDYHRLVGGALNRLNDMLRKYLTDNENKFEYEPYYLVDVASAFEEIYNASSTRERWSRLFCPDGIHPANEGHALIAEANQKLLTELGLASSDALEKYKTLRKEQLDYLYSMSVSTSSVKKKIDESDTFGDVTLSYFNEVDGKDISYRVPKNVKPVGNHFDEDKIFNITTFSVSGLDLTKASVSSLPNPISIMSKQNSYIAFYADGTFEMKYAVVDGIKEVLSLLVNWGLFALPIDVNELIDLDIDYLQERFLEHMFPGFDYTNLIESLDLISDTIGFSITGVDLDSQAVREMAKELSKSGHLVLESLDIINRDLGVTWKGTYRTVEQKSKLTGETYTAIYIGEEFYKGESYLRFTYKESPSGWDTVRMTVDVVDLVCEGRSK